MDLGGITQSKVSQTEKDKYQMISLICGILKKKKKKNQETQNLSSQVNRLVLPELEGERANEERHKFPLIK